MHNELKKFCKDGYHPDYVIMLAQDNGLTRQCQHCYVKPADFEKRVGSKIVNLNNYKMMLVLDFLTAELWWIF